MSRIHKEFSNSIFTWILTLHQRRLPMADNTWKDVQHCKSLRKCKKKTTLSDMTIHLLEWLQIRRLTTLSMDEDVEQPELS